MRSTRYGIGLRELFDQEEGTINPVLLMGSFPHDPILVTKVKPSQDIAGNH
ncbi:MAG: hypothetical protein HY879_03185 [Deltaproteobacteria bacterium]|nr:hypothetical protein [Deltaproteobacteria bacterium]